MFKNFFNTAWRNLARNKVNASLNILGLTIGVVVCLLIGVWLQREMSFDDFHPKGDQVFRLSNTFKSESESFSQAPSGPAFGAQLPKQLSSVQSACRLFGEVLKVRSGNDQFIENNCMIVDSNFFSFFGFQLLKGQPTSVLLNREQLVLTEKLAKKYFGNADNAIGRQLMIDDEYPMIVSGVAKDPVPNSHIQFDLLLSFTHLRKKANEKWKFDIDNAWMGGWPHTYVQVADPAKWKETEKQINEVAARFCEKDWKQNKMSYHYFLQPIRDIHLTSDLRYDAENNGSLARVRVFSIVGIIVLLLACINYVNLTTAGAMKRAKETSVRKVIGATKKQLVRQFLIETLVISAVAVLLGVVTLKLVLPSFSAWTGQPYEFLFTLKNILLVAGFIVFISFIAGIYPAFLLSSFNPAVSLKGNFSFSNRGNFIRRSLVVFQFTISIALVASLIIISQQMQFIKNKSLGFNSSAVVEVPFFGDDTVRKQYPSLRNKLLESPYILNVSKHNNNVVGGLGNGWTTTENLDGKEISTSLYQMAADTAYFNTYDMKLAAGRFFEGGFSSDSAKAVLVNEAAVQTFGWKTAANAIGKRFGKDSTAQYVVGVIKDFNFEPLHKPVEAVMIAYSTQGNTISLKIDTRHTDEALNQLKKSWAVAIPNFPLQFSFVDDKINQQYGNENKMQKVFYGFAGLSLLIACLGLFGLSMFVVERKVKEIGIRKVLGASVPGVVNLLSRDFVKLVCIAILIATPLSWLFMKEWLKDFAYRVDINWLVFGLAGCIAIGIAIITVSFQAVKAALANPVKSLRTE
ncbi:MAG: ABC transporter permease [Ferruginibacter sp.]